MMETDTTQIQTETNTKIETKENNFKARVLESNAERTQYRSVLAQIEAEAFKHDPKYLKHNTNLMQDIPDSIYYDKNNLLIILEDPETKVVEGFTLLEPREVDTFYETISCVVHRGKGNISKLLAHRDEVLKDRNIKYVVAHVDTGGSYIKTLERKYKMAEPREMDSFHMDIDQTAVRMEI